MKAKALAATDATLDASSQAALNEDFTALRDQITNIVDSAEFNGVNLIANGAANYAALADVDGASTITVTAQDLSLGAANVTVTAASDIASTANATATLALVEASIDNVNNALATLGTQHEALQIHNTFVSTLSDALETGIGNLVDADLAKESANLQAAQVKQQLGTQALSIANQAPSAVLSFFQ